MDLGNTEDFIIYVGNVAQKYSTELAHATLFAVAVWVSEHPGGGRAP